MRKVLVCFVVVLALPTIVFAQTQKQTFSVFLSDLNASRGRSESRGGWSWAIARSPTTTSFGSRRD